MIGSFVFNPYPSVSIKDNKTTISCNAGKVDVSKAILTINKKEIKCNNINTNTKGTKK